jgi:poly-gamma-glutamate capsule biosynthesis protein CapA/YwtB (metallophosphatase superfamily)
VATLFLCGDVMTGRGIDQILPHPSDPLIHEDYVKDARKYVELAESVNGKIPRRVEWSYIWGDALPELERLAPDARIINLETSVTASHDFWPDKGINYRMHPANAPCLGAARIDACSLANNHALDYGRSGLLETLETLAQAQIGTVGAARNVVEARQPIVIEKPSGRIILFACGTGSSGLPLSWAAGTASLGVNRLPDLSKKTAEGFQKQLERVKRPGDVVIVAIHWGSNWGYDIPAEHVTFAHWLIDGAVDIVHGHSSHHPRPIEVYRNRLILYGCGDFINDYEGIPGYEQFRDDLVLMYFATVDPATGELERLVMSPMQLRKFRLERASRSDAQWLRDRLEQVSPAFGAHFEVVEPARLSLRWQ